ncbi:protein HBS1 [Phlebotomus argentipes]|uniref:protein HBS1 n=1 Tax=Phlebotomus argentipes TaxID=94469 RepID=UPI002892F71F|nr:protein HBS1 [Phlebotomus argentipes]
MSRHRNVRSMDYKEEYDGYDDVFGHSVDDEGCISPTDAQQWIYDRARGQQSIVNFMASNRDIQEEDEGRDDEEHEKERRDSESYQLPELPEEELARLLSCMDEIRSIVGDSVSEKRLVETIMHFQYDMTRALDSILNPAPQTAATASAKAPDKEASSAMEKGVGPRLLEKFTKPLAAPTVTVTPTTDRTNVKRGFEVNSPNIQSPVMSGRNTPEIGDEGRTPSRAGAKESQRNAQEMYQKERKSGKSHIHMVVIGHVDAGKSTLMGHLLFDLGNVPQRVMHKYEQESKKIGKSSFMYAWVLDETGEERTRGITMDVGSSRFETDNKIVTLLDAPGHKDFIPNMISGATQADVALLVVDATTGEFETGFESGGQTREHALLVRSLGVSQLGVVVNKLDTANWSQERFDEIVGKLRVFLKQAGFKESDITYIPCSGLTGENLVKAPADEKLLSWYSGPTLVNVIDNFRTPERSVEKPFRLSVNDIFKGTGSGLCISGRIETGVVCLNDKVLVCPSREQVQVKGIQIDEISHNSAFAGDQVSISLSGADISNISVGHILSDMANPVPVATRIRARIVVFNVRVPITIGFPVLLHHQSSIEPASIVKLKAQLHKGSGEVIKKNPRCLGNNSCALVEIETIKAICVEKYSDFKELGRIMLRVGGVTIAAGLITEIVK